MAGSLLMVAAIVVFGLSQGTFSLVDAGSSGNEWVFLGFMIAFAVKAPHRRFHGWLRTAYTEAPPEVAAMLSGVVSKAAVFGLDLGSCCSHFPGPVESWRTVVLVLAARLVCSTARSSPSGQPERAVAWWRTRPWRQMSLIVLGIFAPASIELGHGPERVPLSVSHGLVSAAMFLLAAMLIQRTGTDRFS